MNRYCVLVLVLLAYSCMRNDCEAAVLSLTTNYSDGNSFACVGTEVVVTCKADEGLIRWFTGGSNIALNAQNTEPTNFGVFEVVVTSSDGNMITSTASTNVTASFTNGTSLECQDSLSNPDSETVVIYLADIPGPPSNFKRVSSTFSSVTLSWSPPSSVGGSSVTGYSVAVKEQSGSAVSCPESQCSLGPSELTTTIENLTFNLNYTFNISAINCGGTGSTASIDVFVVAEAPGAPVSFDVCVGLDTDGTELSLRMSWQCPTVNQDLVPAVSNYLVSVGDYGASIPTDCRCDYSNSMPIDDDATSSLYSVAVSANNSVGSSNEETVIIYSSANISSEVVKTTSSSALVAVSISWQACDGVTANIVVSYGVMGSGGLQSSVRTLVTLPITNRIFVPLNELGARKSYQYSVSLESKASVVLGTGHMDTFNTADNEDAVTITNCSDRSSTDTNTGSQAGSPHTTSAVIEECSNTNEISLLIGILIVGALAVVAFLMFIFTLFMYVRQRKINKYSYSTTSNSVQMSPVSGGGEKMNTVITNLNHSYSQFSGMPNAYIEPNETYEVMKPSRVPRRPDGYDQLDHNRLPAPLPPLPTIPTEDSSTTASNTATTIEPLYSEADADKKISTKQVIDNPAYSRKQGEERYSTTEGYLIITEDSNNKNGGATIKEEPNGNITATETNDSPYV